MRFLQFAGQAAIIFLKSVKGFAF